KVLLFRLPQKYCSLQASYYSSAFPSFGDLFQGKKLTKGANECPCFFVIVYLISWLISLNFGCSAVFINSNKAISTEDGYAPSKFIFCIAICLFSAVLEEIASWIYSTCFPCSINCCTV